MEHVIMISERAIIRSGLRQANENLLSQPLRLQNKLLLAENGSSTDEEDASEGSLSALDRLLLQQRR